MKQCRNEGCSFEDDTETAALLVGSLLNSSFWVVPPSHGKVRMHLVRRESFFNLLYFFILVLSFFLILIIFYNPNAFEWHFCFEKHFLETSADSLVCINFLGPQRKNSAKSNSGTLVAFENSFRFSAFKLTVLGLIKRKRIWNWHIFLERS